MSVEERTSLYSGIYSKEGVVGQNLCFGATSGAWPAAQRAIYYPHRIPYACVAYKFYWQNGATAATDTVQMGLYLPDGTDGGPSTRLINGTGAVASGINVCQYDDFTDVPLAAGWYWLAVLVSGTTTTFFRGTYATLGRGAGIYQQASLASLPNPAVPAAPAAGVYPNAGIVHRAAP